jgi:hypothetical protein
VHPMIFNSLDDFARRSRWGRRVPVYISAENGAP